MWSGLYDASDAESVLQALEEQKRVRALGDHTEHSTAHPHTSGELKDLILAVSWTFSPI